MKNVRGSQFPRLVEIDYIHNKYNNHIVIVTHKVFFFNSESLGIN